MLDSKLLWVISAEYARLCIADDLARILRGEQPEVNPQPERRN